MLSAPSRWLCNWIIGPLMDEARTSPLGCVGLCAGRVTWPFLVGGAICLVNSVNERDLSLLTSYTEVILRG